MRKADVLLNNYEHTKDKLCKKLCQKFEHGFYRKSISDSSKHHFDLLNLLLEKAKDYPELEPLLFELINENHNL